MLELIPIIGPIISAVPAVLLAATVGPGTVVAALVLYTLVQQVENNFLVPKIQGDSVELHPSLVMFAIIVGGSLAGLLGAILALPMTAAFRDVVRYLFRRLSPGRPVRAGDLARQHRHGPRRWLTRSTPTRILQVDPEAEDEVIRAAYRRLARKYHPDLAAGPDAGRMAAINAAWSLVGTPAARAAYDRSRADRAVRAGRERRARDRPAPDRPSRAGPTTPGRTPPAARPAAARRRAPATPQPPPRRYPATGPLADRPSGGGFDASMRSPDGLGAAGPPPGRPSGSVLNFGRYSGWSLGEIARKDLDYIEWLDRTPIGRTYRDEVDAILRAAGRRQSASTDATERRGLFRRR